MKEYRCRYCNKLFFKGNITNGVVEVKCRNCKNFNIIKEGNSKVLLFSDGRGDYKK